LPSFSFLSALLARKGLLTQPELNQDMMLSGYLLTPFPQSFPLGCRHLLFFQLNFSQMGMASSCAIMIQQPPRRAFYRVTSEEDYHKGLVQASAEMQHAVDQRVGPVSDQTLEIAALNVPGVVLRMPTVEKDVSLPLESALQPRTHPSHR
jgi:hypothetical protein